MARTDVDILTGALCSFANDQASVAKLGEALDWDVDKVRRVVARAETAGSPVFVGKAGVIKYRGSEIGSSVGLYSDVQRVIEHYWGERTLGLRNVRTAQVAHGGTHGGGVWSHPDLVMAADPKRRDSADEPARLHAIEVETTAGYDIRSVYQAHAQARGANYAWVFGCRPETATTHWKRVMWTAEELGVGVVTFTRPHAFGTWITHREADRLQPTDDDRRVFVAQVIGATSRDELGL